MYLERGNSINSKRGGAEILHRRCKQFVWVITLLKRGDLRRLFWGSIGFEEKRGLGSVVFFYVPVFHHHRPCKRDIIGGRGVFALNQREICGGDNYYNTRKNKEGVRFVKTPGCETVKNVGWAKCGDQNITVVCI